MKLRRIAAAAALASLALAAAPGARAITINLINTGGVEQGTNAYTAFSAAAHFWSTVLTDDATMNFNVGFRPLGGTVLGQAGSSAGLKTQTAWRDALLADASTALDTMATTHLASFSSTTVRLNTSVQKALGLFTGSASASDASITFNSDRPFDFDTRDGFADVASDFVAVAVHEMGHALGFTSVVSSFTTNNSRPTNTDVFRYKNGAFDLTWDGDPYFSIDGGASQLFGRSGFSNGADGFQTSHWKEGARVHDGSSCTVLTEAQIGVMDPTGGLCQQGIVTALDLAMFDALGWNLSFDILANPTYQKFTSQILQDYLDVTAVPEPGSWAMLAAGLGFAGVALRRRGVRGS